VFYGADALRDYLLVSTSKYATDIFMINTSYAHTSRPQFHTVKSRQVNDVVVGSNDYSPNMSARATRFDLSDYPAAFKALSREQLAEIRLNRSGLYTEEEVLNAGGFLYMPQSAACKKSCEAGLSNSQVMKAVLDVLDQAGPLERQTFEWAESRAAVAQGYEFALRYEGKEPENVDIEHSLYRMLKDFYDNYVDMMIRTGTAPDRLSEPEYLRIKDDYFAENRTGLSIRI